MKIIIKANIVICQPITGGAMNTLYGCHLKDDVEQSDMIVVRLHGQKTGVVVSFEDKALIYYMLHKAGIGTPLYATFSNGIAYGYAQGQCLDETTVKEPHKARY